MKVIVATDRMQKVTLLSLEFVRAKKCPNSGLVATISMRAGSHSFSGSRKMSRKEYKARSMKL